ncbi:uncharacterized protein [Anabrus simplex]|uniref:uncharacterized protein n=1 Tax=Anabrus simplex TaxID=316456 RepID=UPI0035A2B19B
MYRRLTLHKKAYHMDDSVRLCAALHGSLAEHVEIRELQLEDDTRVVEELGRTPKETENSTSSWEDVLKKREMVIEQREELFEKKAKDVEKARKERGVGESM